MKKIVLCIVGGLIVADILNKNKSIGAILEQNPTTALWECQDGTYSTAKEKRYACRWHGGVKNEATIVITSDGKGSELNVVDVPLDEVNVNHKWFQNRTAPYSVRSVDNIVNAVDMGSFKWVNFDPITLYKNKKGEYFILSGHSRTESFKRLCEVNAEYKGRSFCKIPAKIIEGITLAEAQKIARESNTLSTPETDLERTEYYRKLRMDEQLSDQELMQAAKRTEGRNANFIIALSFLSPTGKTWNALQSMENADETSYNNLKNISRWIGNAKRQYAELLNTSHENEIYDWLVIHKGYGTAKNQISNEREFKDRLYSIINRSLEFGQLNKPLNIMRYISKSPTEKEYDHQVDEANKNIKYLEIEIKNKTSELARRGGDELQIKNATEGLEASLRRARLELQRLLQNKGRILEQSRNEPTLFGIIRKSR
jgi:hypothetical protein